MLTRRTRRREKERVILRSLVERQHIEIQHLRQQNKVLESIITKQEDLLRDGGYPATTGDLADYMEDV